MAGKKGQKKRVWSDDGKRSICEQTTTAGVSVAQVARRYSMRAYPVVTHTHYMYGVASSGPGGGQSGDGCLAA